MDEGDHNAWAQGDWLERVNQELTEDLSRAQLRIQELEAQLAAAVERERKAFEAARDEDLEHGSTLRREYPTFDDYLAAQKKEQP